MLTEEEIKSFLSSSKTGEAGIKKVKFPSLEAVKGTERVKTSLHHLEDVQIEINVELGQAWLKVRELLGLAEGSVIKVDKVVGEEVMITMNQQRFAKGEVVIINDSFGVRIVSVNHSYSLNLTEGLA